MSAFYNTIQVSVAGGSNVTLTEVQLQNGAIELIGAITANIDVILPNTKKRSFEVFNSTTGDYTLTVKTSDGTGVAISQGSRAALACDGTNVGALLLEGDIAGQMEALLEANPGWLPEATAPTEQVQSLVGSSAENGITINGNGNSHAINPGDSQSSIQSGAQGMGGPWTDVIVAGSCPALIGVTTEGSTLPNGGPAVAAYDSTNDKVYIFVWNTQDIYKYDPVANTISLCSAQIPSGITSTEYFQACFNPGDGNIYLFGGHGSQNIYAYDPSSDTMGSALSATLPNSQTCFMGVAYNPNDGCIYLYGGGNPNSSWTFTNAILKFNPSGDGSVTTLSETLPSAMAGVAAVFEASSGDIFLFGGSGSNGSGLDASPNTNIYVHSTTAHTCVENSFSTTLPVTMTRHSAYQSAGNDTIYLIAGLQNGSWSSTIYQYVPGTGSISSAGVSLPQSIGDCGIAFNGNNAWICGGDNGSSDTAIYEFSAGPIDTTITFTFPLSAGSVAVMTLSGTTTDWSASITTPYNAGQNGVATPVEQMNLSSIEDASSASSGVGTICGKFPIYNSSGTLIGYVPVYESIT